jgi:hypothetical protein
MNKKNFECWGLRSGLHTDRSKSKAAARIGGKSCNIAVLSAEKQKGDAKNRHPVDCLDVVKSEVYLQSKS